MPNGGDPDDAPVAPDPAKQPEAKPQPEPRAETTADTTSQSKSKDEEQRESARSAVRVIVTYLAAGFLFVVGAAVVGYLIATNQNVSAKELFMTILPIAAAVVTYWFATRKNESLTADDLVKIMQEAKKREDKED